MLTCGAEDAEQKEKANGSRHLWGVSVRRRDEPPLRPAPTTGRGGGDGGGARVAAETVAAESVAAEKVGALVVARVGALELSLIHI